MRKPNTGMIDYLLKKWDIKKNKSLIVGDKESDKMLSFNSKIKFYHVKKEQDLLVINKKKII